MPEWRAAKSLLKLREQVNALAPNRSILDDGLVGDLRHQATNSDHNPHVKDPPGPPVVTAMDITHDPQHGFDSYKFADMLISEGHRDKRLKYVISNSRIAGDENYAARNGVRPWTWGHYGGSNPHDHHVHISVDEAKSLYDDITEWNIKLAPPDPNAKPVDDRPRLGRGSRGADVSYLQTMLNLKNVDGVFGPNTEAAVVAFQSSRGLVADGVVGPQTWRALLDPTVPRIPTMDRNRSVGIKATTFGGPHDIERSAYDGRLLNDTGLYVALPFRFAGTRPKVRVQSVKTMKSAVASIEDVGPWNINDPYWESNPIARPQAESGRDKTGRKTNGAGIDLSPGLIRAIGEDPGASDWSGFVNWNFEGDTIA